MVKAASHLDLQVNLSFCYCAAVKFNQDSIVELPVSLVKENAVL